MTMWMHRFSDIGDIKTYFTDDDAPGDGQLVGVCDHGPAPAPGHLVQDQPRRSERGHEGSRRPGQRPEAGADQHHQGP